MAARTRIVLAFTAFLALLFEGCSTRQHVPATPGFVKMETRFDYAEHRPYAENGDNGMSGRSLINEQGNVFTCAGNRVLLLPGTHYFQEMIGHITAGSEPLPPEARYPSLKGMIRRTQCNAEGHFSFSELPAGRWFVLTQVNGVQTSVLIGEVTVSNGTIVPVLLTDRHIVGR